MSGLGDVLNEAATTIPAKALEREFVRVADLSEALGISDVTARADLDAFDHARAVGRGRRTGVRAAPSFLNSM